MGIFACSIVGTAAARHFQVEFFVDGARLALNDGSIFGKEGEGFMRLNAGCPRSILVRALSQLEEAYENRGFRQQQSQN